MAALVKIIKPQEKNEALMPTDEKNCNRTALSATNMESNFGNEPVGKEKTERLDSRVDIHIISYRKRKHDPDGVSAKAALDGLVRCGILTDDSTKEIRKVTFESIISKEEQTIIEITEIN